MSDIKKLKKQFTKSLKDLDDMVVIKEIIKSPPYTPDLKRRILITTSALKTKLLGEEFYKQIKVERFFSSLATLRMIFEETILLTFVLSKIEKSKDPLEVDRILVRVATGRRTRSTQGIEPYNIITMGEEAEKYLTRNFKNLEGMFRETYTLMSDYVHPNAPSHYYFFQDYGDKIKFVYKKKPSEQNIWMVLNNGCMTLDMYTVIWFRLSKIGIPKGASS